MDIHCALKFVQTLSIMKRKSISLVTNAFVHFRIRILFSNVRYNSTASSGVREQYQLKNGGAKSASKDITELIVQQTFRGFSASEMQRRIDGIIPAKVSQVRNAEISLQVLADILHGAAKHKLQVSLECFTVLLSQNNEQLNPQTFWKLLYGLKSFYSDSGDGPAIMPLVSAITKKAIHFNAPVNDMDISLALYGLQHLSSRHMEVMRLLSILAPKFKGCRYEFSGGTISTALFGLQSMSSKSPEVRMMLSLIAQKICESSLTNWSIREISVSFIGLKEMTCEEPEVRRLLSLLTDKVASCREDFDSTCITNIFHGLRNMSSEHIEVRNILLLLPEKISNCWDTMNSHNLSTCLNGMRNMHSHHREVLNVLSALTERIDSCPEEFNNKGIGNSLFGLRNMSSDHPEVLRIVVALTSKIEESTCQMRPWNISTALVGLQGLSSEREEVRALISALLPKIEECSQGFEEYPEGIELLVGLQGLNSDHEEVRRLLRLLLWKFMSCREDISTENAKAGLTALSKMNSRYRIVAEFRRFLQSCIKE